jgi:hypothetical protein
MRSIWWSEHMEPYVLHTRADEYFTALRIPEIRPSHAPMGLFATGVVPRGIDLAPQGSELAYADGWGRTCRVATSPAGPKYPDSAHQPAAFRARAELSTFCVWADSWLPDIGVLSVLNGICQGRSVIEYIGCRGLAQIRHGNRSPNDAI